MNDMLMLATRLSGAGTCPRHVGADLEQVGERKKKKIAFFFHV